jgi:hypothetical protein
MSNSGKKKSGFQHRKEAAEKAEKQQKVLEQCGDIKNFFIKQNSEPSIPKINPIENDPVSSAIEEKDDEFEDKPNKSKLVYMLVLI